ncbi:transcription factor RFX3 isoform X2 [Engraulis encrasicolus]|uniref:transcription factor RFX3 isoform X2 n=1 Tax=Engraulis encrasicolus TaxID=184585 RepID=UPI002FD41915
MQTPEAGADSSTVPLQTSVQPAVSTQQGVSQAQTVQQVQHVYPAQVQYVEENNGVYTNGTIRTYTYTEPQLYSQNSGGSYFDTQGGSAVTQVTTVVTAHGMANSNNGSAGGGGGGGGSGGGSGGTGAGGMGMAGLGGGAGGGGQIISSSGAYLIGGGSGNSMDGSTPHGPASQTPRASPATIEMAIETLQKSEGLSSQRSSLLNSHLQWLLDNYETAEGVSLPRSTLYNHYLRHCQEQKLDPVNAASFGKLIRSIFMGLRTRRLGTRGNSKYHYYGIRVKPDSPLNRLQEDMQYMALRQQPMQQKQRQDSEERQEANVEKKTGYKPVQKVDGMSGENYSGGGGQHAASAAEQTVIAQSQHHQQFLDGSRALPEFAELELSDSGGMDHITTDDVKALQALYREHCEAILDVVVNLQFSLIEKLWQTFWRYSHSNTVEGATITENSGLSEIESRLPRAKLLLLCRNEGVLKWMSTCDHLMYQVLVEILIPDVLRPIPSALTQAIRNFAKSLEGWLSTAMNAVPQRMLQTKVSAVSAFAQTLRRYTSLNHLAQAARAVLQNTSQINQMLSDLNRVDFANVQEQASWVCQCEEGVVQRLEQDFKATLQQQSSLEQWAAWLDNVVSQVLKPYEDRASFPKAARQFLLKWSFYSSMVIRDLTLRSAASFGSFHLIRLLYDEYMFYLVEHRVAQATGETPIGVMGECDQLNAMSPNMDKDEVSEMDSDLDDELEESGEPLAKREKAEIELHQAGVQLHHGGEVGGCEPEIIQVLQVGTMEDGSSAVVGMLSALPSAGGTATIIPAEHVSAVTTVTAVPAAVTAGATEHHILPPGATSTIRHCNSTGSSFAPV